MTPTQALEILRHFLLVRVANDRVKELNDSYEVLRKLVVDDIARKKNQEETAKVENPADVQ